VVFSDKEARKRLTESNSIPAMDLGHMIAVLKRCICVSVVDFGTGMTISIIIIIFGCLAAT